MAKKQAEKLDIISIIAACKSAGVTSLKLEGVEILFNGHNEAIINKAPENAIPTQKETEVAPLEQSREERLFNLMCADPLAYEAELTKEENDG